VLPLRDDTSRATLFSHGCNKGNTFSTQSPRKQQKTLDTLSTGYSKQGTGCVVGDVSGRKWQMRARWEPFSAGKFMVHRCNPQKCGEFLHIVPQQFGLIYGGTDNKDSDNRDLLYHIRMCFSKCRWMCMYLYFCRCTFVSSNNFTTN
jgi:hypothetical protein